MKDLLKLSGFEISYHEKSNRVINIKIEDEIIDRLVFPFKKFNITALEYKPFTRFTIAKSLDDLTQNKLSKLMNKIIRDRSTGCFIIGPSNISSKINDKFLVKLSTAVAYLIGIPNYEFLKNTAQVKYNDDDKSSIVINTYGQKPLNEETINFLKNKLQKYSELRNAELEFIQNDISLPNSNKFVNELRKRDSMELVSKNNEINKLNQKLNDLESLSKEKLIFKSLAKEIKIIYPDLNQFEVFEIIKTDFNKIDTVLVFNLRWNDELENQEKLKLNENVRSWLKFQLENDIFEIRSNSE